MPLMQPLVLQHARCVTVTQLTTCSRVKHYCCSACKHRNVTAVQLSPLITRSYLTKSLHMHACHKRWLKRLPCLRTLPLLPLPLLQSEQVYDSACVQEVIV
jgi:hypothetical protein